MNDQATFLLPAESPAENKGISEPSTLPFWISKCTKHNIAYYTTTVFHKEVLWFYDTKTSNFYTCNPRDEKNATTSSNFKNQELFLPLKIYT